MRVNTAKQRGWRAGKGVTGMKTQLFLNSV